MFTHYRAAYARPGTLSFSAAGFIARAAIAIYPIGLVLIVSARTGAYGFAGVVSGAYVLGGAAGNPVAGILVDRLGQRRVMLPMLAAHLVCVAALAALLIGHAPLWTLLIPAIGMGITLVNVGALVRARWSFVWPGDAPERTTAYSLESTLDEVIFVLGPLIATLTATRADPLLTLLLAVVLIAGGTWWFANQRATEPPRAKSGDAHPFALRSRGMVLVTLAMVFMGGVFGSAEVAMVAFCGQHGDRAASGWVVACFAGGSGVAGLIYGGRRWKSPLRHRFVVSAIGFGLLPWLYFAATSPVTLAICTAFVGLGIAPTLIGGFGLVDEIVPVAARTEGLTWIGTGLSVGFGIGAAVVGGIADAHGARAAFALPVGCATLTAVVAVLLGLRLAGRLGSSPRLKQPVLQA